MTAVLLTDDLMTASRVEGAARRAGVTLVTCSDAAGVATRCNEQQVDRLIVDLSSGSGDVATIIERLSAASARRPLMIAFGPHVHEKLLTAAAEAGCEQVVSRGQFFAELDTMFARLANAAAGPVPRDHDASPDG